MKVLILCVLLSVAAAIPLAVPPPPRHRGIFNATFNPEVIAKQVKNWTPEQKGSAWQLSGHFEGDIVLTPAQKLSMKNGILGDQFRWPDRTVPYYIDTVFSEDQRNVILGAFDEYHQKTCIRFRPYQNGDASYVYITGENTGCWSYVGRQDGGQYVNLQLNGCVWHGHAIHEHLHALGFYHMQSATERDDWVVIHWENIESGQEHNFDKYGADEITSYGVQYDYGSIMHYDELAFSKNGQPTITPIQTGAEIGQIEYLSDRDIQKLHLMYGC